MKYKENKEKVESCSNCKFSDPSFNLLYCSVKKDSVGYNEKCHTWTKKHCKIKKIDDEDDGLDSEF